MTQPPAVRRLHPGLPVFLLELPQASVVYTPGNVATIASSQVDTLVEAFEGKSDSASSSVVRLVDGFSQLGQQANEAWEQLRTAEFRPRCLTVYLSNACNLGCSYCFSAETDGRRIRPAAAGQLPLLETSGPLPRIDKEKLAAAARLVAQSCAEQQLPFQLVVLGGGEPTLHWDLLEHLVDLSRGLAEQHGVDWTSYLATHGAIEPHQADWLGANFDHVGVSCDGPADLHDAQRSMRSGSGTFANVAGTIKILRDSGARLTLRSTITRRSLKRQAEIVTFFCAEFGPCDIRFEPMYQGDKSVEAALGVDDAEDFARHFLAAQGVADALDCQLKTSGVRLDEIHGPHCNPLRDVVQITPDGSASACFLVTDARAEGGGEMQIGEFDPQTGHFEMNRARIRQMQSQATEVPQRCESCVNVYHCARDCPDVCPVSESDEPAANEPQIDEPGFRCLVQKELGQRWIIAAAQRADQPPERVRNEETLFQISRIGQALGGLPAHVDAEAIVRQWQLATQFDRFEARSMPQPPWTSEGFHDRGQAAWEALAVRLADAAADDGMSCYVHMPYCDRKCAFCDCYAHFVEPSDQQKHLTYVSAMVDEIAAWGQFAALRNRPLTTVHFGGGTPSYVPAAYFERLLEALRSTFRDTAATEWAMETTTSQLNPDYLSLLAEWGFSRLHVGVQTFHDATRSLVGRLEDSASVMRKLSLALDRGFIVSVDLIYGLPGQTLPHFIDDLWSIVDLGLDGCSLYHLNHSKKNQSFVDEYCLAGTSAFDRYLFFLVGEEILKANGFRKNHFAHFARQRDRNLYYTHVVRGEDLLALGATGDGSFGDYCYRHPQLGDYLAKTTPRQAALEGGLTENAREFEARPLAASIMSGVLDADRFNAAGVDELLHRWATVGMIEPTADGGAWVLTANGSWYVSRLLDEVERATRNRYATSRASS